MTHPTIDDVAEQPLFDRLLALADRVRADNEHDTRSIVEQFLGVKQYSDRVYVKRRADDQLGHVESLHEEGVLDCSKWTKILRTMRKAGGVDVGGCFGPDRTDTVVPMECVNVEEVYAPAEVAAIVAMSRTKIAHNKLERVSIGPARTIINEYDESDAESD